MRGMWRYVLHLHGQHVFKQDVVHVSPDPHWAHVIQQILRQQVAQPQGHSSVIFRQLPACASTALGFGVSGLGFRVSDLYPKHGTSNRS